MTKRRSTPGAAAAVIALSLALAACGSSSSGSGAAGSAASATATPATKAPSSGNVPIAISNYSYRPPTITVLAGTRVTFTNDDQTSHTATSTRTAFDTGTVKPGHGATVVFSRPGTYTYYCQFHAFMHGTVLVK
jgi:plastocyanin